MDIPKVIRARKRSASPKPESKGMTTRFELAPTYFPGAGENQNFKNNNQGMF